MEKEKITERKGGKEKENKNSLIVILTKNYLIKKQQY